MQSRGIDHGSQFAFAHQAHVAEQSTGALCELIQKSVDPLLDSGPVLNPAMHLEDVVAQPAPQLLNGVEPWSIGRQPDRFDPGVVRQGGQHVGMSMDIPVVLDHVQPLHLRIGTLKVRVELDHLLSSHNVAIEIVHLSSQGIERANRAPLLTCTSQDLI